MIVFFLDLSNYSSLAFKNKWQKKERKRSLNGCRLSGGEIPAVGAKATFDSDKNHFFCDLWGQISGGMYSATFFLRRSLLFWKMTAEGHSECSHKLITANRLLTANLFQTPAGYHTGGDRLRPRLLRSLKRPEARLQQPVSAGALGPRC